MDVFFTINLYAISISMRYIPNRDVVNWIIWVVPTLSQRCLGKGLKLRAVCFVSNQSNISKRSITYTFFNQESRWIVAGRLCLSRTSSAMSAT